MKKIGSAEIIARGVFQVSGSEISHAEDATSFVIHFNGIFQPHSRAEQYIQRYLRWNA